MSLFRFNCNALARRLCLSHPQQRVDHTLASSPILDLFAAHRRIPRRPCRPFSCAPRVCANVIDPPQDSAQPPPPKRTVRIGQLPDGRVDDNTIRHIFGRKLSPSEGNNVLRILHHRRTAGSLADHGVDNLGKQFTHVPRDTAVKGLEWLRERYPIDEARAAEEWAEKEANRISYELWLADPETESKYKDPARAFREQMEKEEKEKQQQELDNQKIGILHVGKSQFERNIEEKRQQRLEEIARQAEEKEQREREMEEKLATGDWVRTPSGTQLMKPEQTTYVDIFGREQISRRKEFAEQYSKASEATGAQTEEELLAKTTLLQRLWPMTSFVLFVLVVSWGFAHYYLPPSPSYRLFPDISPTFATISALLAMNGLVAVAWRIMPLWPILTRFFMHVPGYPRAAQSVLNTFSHVQYEHFLANMFMLILAGPVCHDLVGRGVFLGTYISAGAVGTLFSLYWANLGRGNITAHSVGASAALWGIAALYCLLTDKEQIKIPFFKDLYVAFWPKMLFGAFMAFEIVSAFRGKMRHQMDHASHFGGMFVGMSTAAYMRATGFPQNRPDWLREKEVQRKAGVDGRALDVGAMATQGMKEVRQSVGGPPGSGSGVGNMVVGVSGDKK